MQTKSLLNQEKKKDKDLSIGWSSAFSAEEEYLRNDSGLDISNVFDFDQLENEEFQAPVHDSYNRTYSKLQFKELVLKLAEISKSDISTFLKGINLAQAINDKFYIFHKYPIERQALSISKLAIGYVIKSETYDNYDFLLQQLVELSKGDFQKKAFSNFRKALIQKKLINFRTADE